MKEWYGDPIIIWRPVVEPEIPGVERFLTDQPANLLRKGQFHHVPVIAGVTKDEFAGIIKGKIFPFFHNEKKLYNKKTKKRINEEIKYFTKKMR